MFYIFCHRSYWFGTLFPSEGKLAPLQWETTLRKLIPTSVIESLDRNINELHVTRQTVWWLISFLPHVDGFWAVNLFSREIKNTLLWGLSLSIPKGRSNRRITAEDIFQIHQTFFEFKWSLSFPLLVIICWFYLVIKPCFNCRLVCNVISPAIFGLSIFRLSDI